MHTFLSTYIYNIHNGIWSVRMILHLCIRVRISLMDPGSWHCIALHCHCMHTYARVCVWQRKTDREKEREKENLCENICISMVRSCVEIYSTIFSLWHGYCSLSVVLLKWF